MKSFVPLPRSFYAPSAAVVAPALLGHWLIRRTSAGVCGGPIVETEAYVTGDPACHAAPGLTPRNRVMFGEPGRAYVYFIYGCHYCMNTVCRPAGVGEAVLIRALEPVFGVELMRRARRVAELRQLTNGPGKLCQAMTVDRALNGVDLCAPDSPLVVAQNPAVAEFLKQHGPVKVTPRIGITQAADLPLRFYLKRSLAVSRRNG